jgi:hypothetical protein
MNAEIKSAELHAKRTSVFRKVAIGCGAIIFLLVGLVVAIVLGPAPDRSSESEAPDPNTGRGWDAYFACVDRCVASVAANPAFIGTRHTEDDLASFRSACISQVSCQELRPLD